jgi:two-component system, NtrC family, nitrogen regulation response regulator GlnG
VTPVGISTPLRGETPLEAYIHEVVSYQVLVVDDDAAIRGLVVAALKRDRLTVDTAKSGREAVQKLNENAYQVIVLDLMMPDVSGFDVLKVIEETHSPETCVVIVSAASEKTIDSVQSPYVRAKLRKPFDLSAFIASVQECLGVGSNRPDEP